MGFRNCASPEMLPSCAPGFLSPPKTMAKERGAVWGRGRQGQSFISPHSWLHLLSQGTRPLQHCGSWYADSRKPHPGQDEVWVHERGRLHRGPHGEGRQALSKQYFESAVNRALGAVGIIAASFARC